jgi:threonine dehydrogenase-like Zn-dependent dehydrogenase
MRALRLERHGGVPILADAPEPSPGAGEVLVEVSHCAVAVGELLVSSGERQEYQGTRQTFIYPHTVGFQGVGRVVEVGTGVASERCGERVTINGVLGCGTCPQCRAGTENRCERHALLGLDSGYPGCMAEYVCVPERNAHPWPEHISPTLAPFISELATMAHVVRRIGCGPGEELAVVGAGQTGVLGVAAGRLAGADLVISIDVDPSRLALVQCLGADAIIDAQESDPVAAVRELTGEGVSRAIEAVGTSQTVAQTIRMLAPRGVGAMLGTGRDIVLDLPDYERVISKEIILRGCLGKTNREYALALSWVRDGRVDMSVFPVEVYPLDRYEDAWRAAERGGGPRVVIEINPTA